MSDVRSLETLRSRCHEEIDRFLAVVHDTGPFPERQSEVSKWNALTHAEHMALADRSTLRQIDNALANGEDGSDGTGDDIPKLGLLGRMVLWTGWIPRGSGKAPEMVRPQGVDRQQVEALFTEAKAHLERLPLERIATSSGRATHPVFGGLTARQWLKFVSIHHRHHLKIIDDIRRSVDG